MKINKLYSYVFSPPKPILDDVARLKEQCNDIIGDFESKKSIAHITVTEQEPEKTDVLIRRSWRLEQDLSQIPSVILTAKNFGHFYNKSRGHTIYITIEMNEHLTKWFKKVKLCFGDHSKSVPHITIARNINDKQYLSLWPHFKDLTYHRQFKIEHLTILENGLRLATNSEGLVMERSKIFSNIPLGDEHIEIQMPWTLFDEVN